MAALIVAISFASSARMPRGTSGESFNVMDTAALTTPGQQSMCGLAAAQVEEACGGSANVQRRLFFGDRGMNTEPTAGNHNAPYHLSKVTTGGDGTSSLHLNAGNSPSDSFQIWGNGCGPGSSCPKMAHKFRADGTAAMAGGLVLGSPDAQTATDHGSGWTGGSYPVGGGLNVYYRDTGKWTHMPWVDGNNYISNDTRVDGALDVQGQMTVSGANLCIDDACVSSDMLAKIIRIAGQYEARVSEIERKNTAQDGLLTGLGGRADKIDAELGVFESQTNTALGAWETNLTALWNTEKTLLDTQSASSLALATASQKASADSLASAKKAQDGAAAAAAAASANAKAAATAPVQAPVQAPVGVILPPPYGPFVLGLTNDVGGVIHVDHTYDGFNELSFNAKMYPGNTLRLKNVLDASNIYTFVVSKFLSYKYGAIEYFDMTVIPPPAQRMAGKYYATIERTGNNVFSDGSHW